MSDNIPWEIQAEILKRLPVKSLIQFRSVSKPWKSLIDNSVFISGYGVRHTQPHQLVVRYKYLFKDEKYVTFVDDDNTIITLQEFAPPVPVLANLLEDSIVVGSSHGLLCFFGFYHESAMAVVWNPSIRKSIGVVLPGQSEWKEGNIAVGFGVCPVTHDPTIVKISFNNGIHWVVQIFTLSLGTWKTLSTNLPRGSIAVTWYQVVIDRFIYWIAYDRIVDNNGGFRKHNLIMSFDTTTHEFKVVDLPDSLSHQQNLTFDVSKLNGSLVVLTEKHIDIFKHVSDIWMMDDVTKSFTKLYTITTPFEPLRMVLGFRKNGQPILEKEVDHDEYSAALELYEPSSQHFREIGIYGGISSFFVTSYMETLLLLDHSDSTIYSNIN